MIAVFSSGIKKIPYLEVFLGQRLCCQPEQAQPSELTAVAVWGEKSNPANRRAQAFASRLKLPLWRLEDGFLRSLDLGCQGAPPYSLIIDRTGIYYDASAPSDLENLLNRSGWETPELMRTAQRALDQIIANDLSKYNQAPPAPAGLLGDGRRTRVLLLDQTYEDKSVNLGQAGPETFTAMLEAALSEHPHGDIFIKTHPDVLAGRKKGYLTIPNSQVRVNIICEPYSPLSLLRQADEVYAVTSQMGFEALFLNKTVHCFGLPFYAGWGLTQDRQNLPRRAKIRTLLEVLAAAYILYPRYVEPFTGQLADIMAIIQLLAVQRHNNEKNRGCWAAYGFSRWKRPFAKAFTGSTSSRLRFFYRLSSAARWAAEKNGRVLAWSSGLPDNHAQICSKVPLVRVEDGFLRSVGLGSDFHYPYSLVLDATGIYYDPQNPSDLEKLLVGYDFQRHPQLLQRAAALSRVIVAKGLSKYNVGHKELNLTIPENRAIILAPGQVEDDASIRRGAGEIKTNLQLLQAVRAAAPKAFIIYKPHPDVESLNRRGAIAGPKASLYADLVVEKTNIQALLAHCHEVHTITSLVGFEALLKGLKVTTYGGPFYAGWGLTVDRLKFPRRNRLLTLDELVAAALIIYPSYYDWGTGLFCDPEDIIRRLTAGSSKGLKRRADLLWLGRNLVKKFWPSRWA